MNMSEISEIHNYSAVAELFIWREKGVCLFLQSIFIYYPRVHTALQVNMVGELITWYLHDKSDSNEHYICVDVIEDFIDDDKDVIMNRSIHCIYNIYN